MQRMLQPLSWHISQQKTWVTHVFVTKGAGYAGSHATLRLLKDSNRVTTVDNRSCGNIGAVKVIQDMFPKPGKLNSFMLF
ncbi:putative UDP-arabinose 4-epimerase 2 [Helianthus annuus]|uniref:putative UDP-arabinose 4-epimerase 2 n=1 Tax=Helianthus annuus TaxID=4232 RepID=UPI001652E536|nr:putative UDP-arabinose 4-epimerase 2 [Helianthus annuus]